MKVNKAILAAEKSSDKLIQIKLVGDYPTGYIWINNEFYYLRERAGKFSIKKYPQNPRPL